MSPHRDAAASTSPTYTRVIAPPPSAEPLLSQRHPERAPWAFREVHAALVVATGRFNRICVLVPRDDGVFQVASGGVYSYYEFVNDGPLLTDETWRAILDSGEAPERPAWESPLFPRP